MSGFSFGTPATTTSATTFGFNTQTPAASSFGAAAPPSFATAPPSFAAATATSAVAPTSTPGLNFGFGAAGTAAAQPTQPVQPAQPAQPSGLGGSGLFSTVTAQPQTTQTTGLSFGTPATGAPVAAKPIGLTFGTPAATTAAPGTSSAGTGLTFGASTSTGGLSFGTATTSAAAGTTGGLNFGTTSSSGGLSFGTTTSAAPVSTALSFGAPTATTGASSLFGASTGGLFGAKPTTTVALTTTSAPTTTNRGLGGLDVSVSNKGLAQGSTSPTAAKENLLPNELMQTIDGFKEFVKTQKVTSSDIARGSARPLNRCAEDTASLMEMLTTLAGSVQRDRSLVDKLKLDTAKALQNAEIAQRTHDTPAGLQYENTAPLLFFMELSEQFEHDLMVFKSQIESTEKHIQTMMTPKTLTPQELTTAMNNLHESLVAVAGRLQGVHSKVQQQKEQYLNFRKYVLKDSTNVFEDIRPNGKSGRNSIGKVTSGPTPFGPGNRSFLSSTALNSSQTPNYGTSNPLVWGNVTATTPSTNLSTSTTMKPPTTGLSFNPPTNLTAPLSNAESSSSFQLQKPPVGSKRGKH